MMLQFQSDIGRGGGGGGRSLSARRHGETSAGQPVRKGGGALSARDPRPVALPQIAPARSGSATPRGGAPAQQQHGAYPSALSPGRKRQQNAQSGPSKRSPSEVAVQIRATGMLQHREDMRPKITKLLDMANFSHNTDSAVPVGEPLFWPCPTVVGFVNFEGLQTYDATLTLRNQDTVARRVKVLPADSSYFEVIPMGRKPNDKVAPGMEAVYTIRFKPNTSLDDYSYNLTVVTEREEFLVPVKAIGGTAILEFPDVVDFGITPVKYETARTVLVRNLGDKPTKFLLKAQHPFATSVGGGYLEAGASTQVDILFKPEVAEDFERDLLLVYGDNFEAYVRLCGTAENVNVSFSDSRIQICDTFIALSSQTTLVIYNNSDIPVDFSWRSYPSLDDEIKEKMKLHKQLKVEEEEELSNMRIDLKRHPVVDDDEHSRASSDSDDSEDETQHRKRASVQPAEKRTRIMEDALGRRYKNIGKAVMDDPMFFYDEIFAVEPLSGKIWAKSKQTVMVTFTPKAALSYQCLAYCSIIGQANRVPVVLQGQGVGPKAVFSYDELDVGDIFIESNHKYEVDLINKGDIAVNFQLVSNPTPFGTRFKFTPSQGRLEVGAQCTLTMEFCPDTLGEFHETFYWDLVGSDSSIPLTIKGRSIAPTLHFDVERISFGVVSCGFLSSKTLTLTNTSEVPLRFALRIPGDGRFNQKEFEVIPAKGTLQPSCQQKVQIDFLCLNVKTYDLCLIVDVDGVGQELASVPLQARCTVPTITLEPAKVVEYGNTFLRYPSHQTLVLQNSSVLPAKYQILPQEENTKVLAEFEPDQPSGTIPPQSSHVVTLTLTTKRLGLVQLPLQVRILGHTSSHQLTLTATSMGPIVTVEPDVLDWGNVNCLEPSSRYVSLTNESVIDAEVRCLMKSKDSLWKVETKSMKLRPKETVSLGLTLCVDETMLLSDILHVLVLEGEDVQVAVKAKGTSTPVVCKLDEAGANRDSLSSVNFGTHYTTQTVTREIWLENHGRVARKLVWLPERPHIKKTTKGEAPEDISIFTVVPESMVLDGKSKCKFQLTATSPTPGLISEYFLCQEYRGNERKGRTIFRTEFCGNFVHPQLSLSSSTVNFKFLWDQAKDIFPMSETITIKNTAPLDMKFFLRAQPPFSVDKDSIALASNESTTLRIDFDPGFKVDRVSGVVKQRLVIGYMGHPQKDHINLVGEVVFPNVVLSVDKVDFGAVLNGTRKHMSISLSNPYLLPVDFQWSFVEEEVLRLDLPTSPTHGTLDGDAMGALGGGDFGSSSSVPGSPPNTGSSWFNRADSLAATMPQQANKLQLSSMSCSQHVGASTMPNPSMPSPAERDRMPREKVDINQIFDILPISGRIQPGETLVTNFEYFGLNNRKFEAVAACQVVGGPEYEVLLKGQAAKLEFRIDKTELDFGEVLFNEICEKEVYVSNSGKVAYNFSFNMQSVSRPGVLDAVPSSGVVQPESKQKIWIKFRPGLPDEVKEIALLEVAHFEPIKLAVRGVGIFPGIILHAIMSETSIGLFQRLDDADHQLRRGAAETRLQILSGGAQTGEAQELAAGKSRETDASKSRELDAGKSREVQKGKSQELEGGKSKELDGVRFRRESREGDGGKSKELEGVKFRRESRETDGGKPKELDGGKSKELDAGKSREAEEGKAQEPEGGKAQEAQEADDEDGAQAVPAAAETPRPEEAAPMIPVPPAVRFITRYSPFHYEVESEVDRHFLCQVLLEREQEMLAAAERSPSKRSTTQKIAMNTKSDASSKSALASTKAFREFPPVIAAVYTCDFGHIVLGQTGRMVINVYNRFKDSISFSIDRKVLAAHGFYVAPDKVKPLAPQTSMKLELTCYRSRENPEGVQELDWKIPVANGPIYEVRLRAHYVLPTLNLSSESVDFGRVLVGQRKRITIKLKNEKAVPMEWEYKLPRSKPGQNPSPADTIFSLAPNSGSLQAGETALVEVSFAPIAAKAFSHSIALKIHDNPTKKTIKLQGQGTPLQVEVRPSKVFKLGPVLPGDARCFQELSLYNPTEYPLEVYSVDFDDQYSEEERMLREYKFDKNGQVELPLRLPGDPLWEQVVLYSERLAQEAQERELERKRLEEENEKEQDQQDAEGGEGEGEEGHKAEQPPASEGSRQATPGKEPAATTSSPAPAATAPAAAQQDGKAAEEDPKKEGHEGQEDKDGEPENQDEARGEGEEDPDLVEALPANADTAMRDRPIPPPSLMQVVSRPPKRQARKAPDCFTIVHPSAMDEPVVAETVPEVQPEQPKKKSGSPAKGGRPPAVPVEQAPEPEVAPPAPAPTRWTIEPKQEQNVVVKFFAEEVGNFDAKLTFEVIGGTNGNAPVTISLSGTTSFPGINSDPRAVFPRCIRNKPANGYASKQFITSSGVFDFGPLLVGRNQSTRIPPDPVEGQLAPSLNKFVAQHVETIRITNNSAFKANVDLALASSVEQGDDAAAAEGGGGKDKDKEKDKPKKLTAKQKEDLAKSRFNDFPFIVEPSTLEVDVGATKEVRISCFPTREDTFSDTIIATVENNPVPVEFPISAIGSVPKIDVETTTLDFGHVLLKEKVTQHIRFSNVSAVPVRWRLRTKEKNGIPKTIAIDSMEGTLPAGEEKAIPVTFQSDDQTTLSFKVLLHIGDTEGLNQLAEAKTIEVKAEAFQMDVVPLYASGTVGVDLGNVRVGTTSTSTLTVANHGKYPVNYEVRARRKAIRNILTLVFPKVDDETGLNILSPGEKQEVVVKCSPTREMQCPLPRRSDRSDELELVVKEAGKTDAKQVDAPLIPLAFNALYNTFSVTPAQCLSFGPVTVGEHGNQEIEITNTGCFKFDWFLFDLVKLGDGGNPKKESDPLSAGPFTLSPSSGDLDPKESKKIAVKFNANEETSFEHKIGIFVDGLREEALAPAQAGEKAGSDSERPKGKVNYREYTLTGLGDTPGIDTSNWGIIFEEEHVGQTLDDVVKIAGKVDIRAFSEDDRTFCFRPVPFAAVSGAALGPPDDMVNIRITNPKAIPCTVSCAIKLSGDAGSQQAGGRDRKGAADEPFELLSAKELQIPGHDHRYAKVRFSPSSMQSFAATFEATVLEGKDPETNMLRFRLQGRATNSADEAVLAAKEPGNEAAPDPNKEPLVGLDRPCINFSRVLVGFRVARIVNIVNKEGGPFNFVFDKSSYKLDSKSAVLSVSPSRGTVAPGTAFPVEVAFTPQEERAFNFNILCHVKRRTSPIVLNVKGEGCNIKANLAEQEELPAVSMNRQRSPA